MAKKMPKGLQEFEASLQDLEYAPRLLPRLADLPESNFSEWMAEFARRMDRVKMAEEILQAEKELARQCAMKVWSAAKKNWSIKELQEATGYDNE